MGMSASQARYLSLTARKSDLEYRGQQINQSRLMLSNQSANLYSSMLSMSVPTPPVETDYMKDVYTFSMNGDTVTLTSSKLSMGRDGYNYDIIYSRPESKNILASSATSDVQKSITRKASNGSASSENVKIKVGYKNADGDETFTSNKSPKKSSLIQMKNISVSGIEHEEGANSNSIEINFGSGNKKLYIQLQDSYGFNLVENKDGNTIDKSNISGSSNAETFTYNDGNEDLTLTRLTNDNLAKIFGGTSGSENWNYNATGGLLEEILGKNDIITVGNANSSQVYMDKNGDIYVMQSANSSTSLFEDSEVEGASDKYTINEGTTIKKYNLVDILGLKPDTSAQFQVDGTGTTQTTPVYYTDIYTGESADQSTDRVYFSGFSFQDEKLNFNYSTAGQNDLGVVQTLDGHSVSQLDDDDLKALGIEKAENKNENGETSGESAITYNYYMDSSTGDVWRQTIKTSTSGSITEEWGIYEAQKQVSFDGKEAQLIDESEWPSEIERSAYSPGEYDCYYLPDDTGTGGSYYLIKNSGTYNLDDIRDNEYVVSSNASRKYDASNTYNIDGNVACVVSSDKVPSTILDAYDADSYIVYATYDDSDTDFSDPIKYYVFPKDDESADAVCSYAYEKSYTGKNELVQARANILVDENGRFSKIDIKGEGTFALEYGQEKDEEAYNEAYRDYEYRLQKYEKEMQDIDAQTALIQEQDKKLELQLKSIDTEHSAIQTELEALKKVIDQNIQSSFGTFGG